MDLKDIKELIRIFDKSDMGEMEVEVEDARVYLSKSAPAQYVSASAPMIQQMMPAQQCAPSASLPSPVAAADSNKESGNIIESPMIGTYYASASPGAATFISIGDVVEKGQTLCIIEAMKIMNTIEAEYKCKIVKMFLDNGKPVEYGQPIFVVEPQ